MRKGVLMYGLERCQEAQRIKLLAKAPDKPPDHVIDTLHVDLFVLLDVKVQFLEIIQFGGREGQKLFVCRSRDPVAPSASSDGLPPCLPDIISAGHSGPAAPHQPDCQLPDPDLDLAELDPRTGSDRGRVKRGEVVSGPAVLRLRGRQ
jgi:hypothetical protein